MRIQILGTAALCALAAAATAQMTVKPGIPPKRGAVPALPAPVNHGSWSMQRRNNHLLEASFVVQPTILPAKGLGLPPESAGGTFAPPPPRPPLSAGPGPVPLPGGAGGPPTVGDLAGPAPSQPLMQGFEGMGPNGVDPPCPDIAAGYDYVVAITSDDLATYDRAGNELFRIDLHDFLGVSTTYALEEPRVIFDPWSARWVMMCHKRKDSTEESSIVVAVTSNSSPFGLTGGWYYDIDAVQTGASGKAFASSFNLGFSNDYLTLGGNMHYFASGFLWSRIWVLDKAAAYAGTSMGSVRVSNLTNPDLSQTSSPCPVEMQASWSESGNIDGTWINNRSYGGDKLTHWKIKDAFGTNQIWADDISVYSYVYPPNATEPDGTPLHAMDSRIESAVTTTDTLGSNGIELFTGFNEEQSGNLACNLFKIDPVSNTKEWEHAFWSSGLDYFNPRVAADFSGSAVWVFTRTGHSAGYYPEARFVDYNRGAFSNSSASMRTGDSCYNGYYWGFYFGGQMDWGDYSANFSVPGQPAKFWLYSQYTKATSWSTYVGATSVWTQGDLSGVTPLTPWYVSGPVGGPFSPATRNYTLYHTGDVGTVYEVTYLPPWLDASPGLGQLFSYGATVTVSVNETADWLTPGTYNDNIEFSSVFNGGSTISRSVQLTVTGDGIAFCTGEAGMGTPCPCNNDNDGSLPAAGCANGVFASGAKLVALGNASVSNDTVTLTAANVHPYNSGLYFQANDAISNGMVFGDGLRCAGGGLIRLQVRFSNSQGVSATTISISAMGGVSAGDIKRYQCWYRDTSGGQPCGVGVNDFNLTNGLQITWGA